MGTSKPNLLEKYFASLMSKGVFFRDMVLEVP
jgi:hypothetical protein